MKKNKYYFEKLLVEPIKMDLQGTTIVVDGEERKIPERTRYYAPNLQAYAENPHAPIQAVEGRDVLSFRLPVIDQKSGKLLTDAKGELVLEDEESHFLFRVEFVEVEDIPTE